jgi:hypothetical protein
LRFATVRAALRERLADRGRRGHRDACNGFQLAFGRRLCAQPARAHSHRAARSQRLCSPALHRPTKAPRR